MDNKVSFFDQELQDQCKELVEVYGETIGSQLWIDDDYYDGEYCNPPSYRWSTVLVPVYKVSTVSLIVGIFNVLYKCGSWHPWDFREDGAIKLETLRQ